MVCSATTSACSIDRSFGRRYFVTWLAANTMTRMQKSSDIVKYLWNTYGYAAVKPLNYRIATWTPFEAISLKLSTLCSKTKWKLQHGRCFSKTLTSLMLSTFSKESVGGFVAFPCVSSI